MRAGKFPTPSENEILASGPRPQPWGRHYRRLDDRTALNAFVLRSGCQGNTLDATRICSRSSARRCFLGWVEPHGSGQKPSGKRSLLIEAQGIPLAAAVGGAHPRQEMGPRASEAIARQTLRANAEEAPKVGFGQGISLTRSARSFGSSGSRPTFEPARRGGRCDRRSRVETTSLPCRRRHFERCRH
jgi:hypothetical protein